MMFAMVDLRRGGPPTLASGLDMAGLGARLRLERQRRHLSLHDLEARTGVSRSMLSEVERGSKVPTILVLDRIATGLDTSIARLLGDERAARVVVLRRGEHDTAHDPSGWERRILSPVLPGVEFELMRTTIPAGVDAGEFAPHAPGSREYLAMERGARGGLRDVHRAQSSIHIPRACREALPIPPHGEQQGALGHRRGRRHEA